MVAKCDQHSGVEGLDEKVKGLRSINWLLQNSHRDVKYSTGNIVSNSLITLHGVRWVQDLSGRSFTKLRNV